MSRGVVTRDDCMVRIRIAIHPGQRRLQVSNPAIEKSAAQVPDIADLAGQKGGMA